MSHRIEQVESTLTRAAQEVIARGLQDPRIRGIVTVTRVTVASDLRTATVYVSVMPKERQDLAMHGIRDATAHLRRKIGDLVRMKAVPQLTFKADIGMKQQAEVFDALARVEQEREDGTEPEVSQ